MGGEGKESSRTQEAINQNQLGQYIWEAFPSSYCR